MAHSLPTFTSTPPEQYDVEADAALVQRGVYSKPSFFNDITKQQMFSSFTAGVQTALNYAGQSSRKHEIVTKRTEETGYRLTQKEFSLLQKRASSISNYAKIPYDTVEDFLIILCFVDDPADMKKIADAVQIAELADPRILRNPEAILNIRGLEMISFAAQALDGLVNLYRKYINIASSIVNESNNDDMNSILSAISGIVGGFGGGSVGPRLEVSEMGNFLSELISGQRIPTNVIAKNPMLQQPSYVGKTMFGELPNALANVDIDQLFNKMIAVFPQPSNGAGTSSFSMQNFNSFSREMPMINLVSKIITGSPEIGSQRKLKQITNIANAVGDLAGIKTDTIVDITRADNAIPMMMAMASSLSGFDKAVFSDSTFKNGWIQAQAAAQQMAQRNPAFMEAARRFL